jgi:hypothetical protein
MARVEPAVQDVVRVRGRSGTPPRDAHRAEAYVTSDVVREDALDDQAGWPRREVGPVPPARATMNLLVGIDGE